MLRGVRDLMSNNTTSKMQCLSFVCACAHKQLTYSTSSKEASLRSRAPHPPHVIMEIKTYGQLEGISEQLRKADACVLPRISSVDAIATQVLPMLTRQNEHPHGDLHNIPRLKKNGCGSVSSPDWIYSATAPLQRLLTTRSPACAPKMPNMGIASDKAF